MADAGKNKAPMPRTASSGRDDGVPLGECASGEPANMLPGEPSNITCLPSAADGASSKNASAKKPTPETSGGKNGSEKAGKQKVEDEHLPGAEADIPLDGRDEVGEAMIRSLPTRTKTSDKPH